MANPIERMVIVEPPEKRKKEKEEGTYLINNEKSLLTHNVYIGNNIGNRV